MNDTDFLPSDFLPSDDLTAEDALTRDLRAFAAEVRPPTLAPSDVSYVVEDTVIGRMLLAVRDTGVLVASTGGFTPLSLVYLGGLLLVLLVVALGEEVRG